MVYPIFFAEKRWFDGKFSHREQTMTKLLPDGKMIGYILFHAFDGGVYAETIDAVKSVSLMQKLVWLL